MSLWHNINYTVSSASNYSAPCVQEHLAGRLGLSLQAWVLTLDLPYALEEVAEPLPNHSFFKPKMKYRTSTNSPWF